MSGPQSDDEAAEAGLLSTETRSSVRDPDPPQADGGETERAPGGPGLGSPRARRRARLIAYGLPTLIYSALAVLAYWPTNLVDSTRLTYTGDDVAEYVWDLAWLPHALFHGHDPFVANAINYPYGANMASNTLAPLLGLAASPLTLGVGPVASYNIVMRLAFVLSALAMYLVLRRWVASRFACFVGGLFYGFSPYMIGQGHDHLGLVFVPFPPLILWVLDELATGSRWSARRAGLWLGVLAGAELLVSAEVLAGVALLAVLGLAYAAIRHRDAARAASGRVLTGLAYALGPFLVLGAWQTYEMLFGAQRVAHSPAPYEIAQFREDLLSPVIPTLNESLGPAAWIARGTSFTSGDYIENGVYLGVPLLILLAVLLWYSRRRRLVGLCAVMAAVAFVFSLGSPLNIDGHVTSIPLPFGLFPHLPLFEDEAASRYSLFVQLFVAVILAIGIDEVLTRRAPPAAGSRWLGSRAGVLAGGALVVALAPVLPRLPYPTFPTMPTELPAYFSQGYADALPTGSVVLTYPFPVWPYDEALLWQAEAQMRFTVVSGPWNEPQDVANAGEGTPPLLDPPTMQVLFNEALYAEPANSLYGPSASGDTLPANDAATAALLRDFLRRYQVDAVVIDPIGQNPQLVTTYLTTALGRGPVYLGGVEVFYDVQASIGR
jgi:hypothetical protein